MKILMVIPYFVPAWSYGGPVKVCYEYSKKLVKKGHLVTVATTDTLNGQFRIKLTHETIDKIKIIRFHNVSNYLAKKFNAYLPLTFPFWLLAHIKEYDIVYCHDLFTFQNFCIGLIAPLFKVPFIIQPHGAFAPVRQQSRFSTSKKIFMSFFFPLFTKTKKIIALTNEEKQDFVNNFSSLSKKIIVIPNGITPLASSADKRTLLKKYFIPKNNKIIGYIGRIQYIKGLDISLQILNKIKNKVNFTFLIIGPNEGEKQNLITLSQQLGIEKNIIFTGLLDGQEKADTISLCDLFLFTSRNEGFPMTILEVASIGIPQIISDTCHVPEIETAQAGYVINLQDQSIFSQKIIELLENKEKMVEMSRNSVKLVQSKFNINTIIDKIEAVLLFNQP